MPLFGDDAGALHALSPSQKSFIAWQEEKAFFAKGHATMKAEIERMRGILEVSVPLHWTVTSFQCMQSSSVHSVESLCSLDSAHGTCRAAAHLHICPDPPRIGEPALPGERAAMEERMTGWAHRKKALNERGSLEPQKEGPRIKAGGGAGILIPVTNRTQLVSAFASVSVLREQLKCQLPIHIVHGGEEGLPADLLQRLKARAPHPTRCGGFFL